MTNPDENTRGDPPEPASDADFDANAPTLPNLRQPEKPRAADETPTWNHEDVISSTAPEWVPPPTKRDVLSEDEARRVLDARFRAAGMNLTADFLFRDGDVVVTLDGYDEARSIGYSYVSHEDADVVTDFDDDAEKALAELARTGTAQVLIVHDRDTPNVDVLERRIDAFFRMLQRP